MRESGSELEPTTGLEPVTCRLRIDPALRKLLCNGARFGAFRDVFGHLGSLLYSSCTTEKRTIEEPIWRRHVARRAGRRHLAGGFCDLYLPRLSAVRMTSGEHDNFGPVGLISTLRCSRVVRAMQPAAPDLILRSVIRPSAERVRIGTSTVSNLGPEPDGAAPNDGK